MCWLHLALQYNIAADYATSQSLIHHVITRNRIHHRSTSVHASAVERNMKDNVTSHNISCQGMPQHDFGQHNIEHHTMTHHSMAFNMSKHKTTDHSAAI